MGESDAPPRFTAGGLAEFLLAPDAGERLAPLAGEDGLRGPGALVLDLRSTGEDEAERASASLHRWLPLLPAVTIALSSGEEGEGRRALAARCDVALATEAEATALFAAFRSTPIAALAYAQLLRAAPRRGIHEALVAESFVYSTLQAGAEFAGWLAGRRRRRRKPADSGPAVRMDRDRGRLEIHLVREEKHNAFSRAMRDGLCEALQLALADPSIDEVVLSGEGPSFCSGGDLDEFGSFPDPAEAHAIRTTRSPALLLSQLTNRVRVEVHGACIGAGAELPAFTPRVIADEDAFFQLPEVGLGLVPGAGGTASLPLRIGRQRTAWLGLSGERIDARTALAWGLVDEVRLGQHVERT
ncbi:MAG: enoyl-CoA hydratase/isomerase family protein [Myxococcota bacterium]